MNCKILKTAENTSPMPYTGSARPSFNKVASAGRPIAAGDCLRHNMHSVNKKPQSMSHQTLYTHFQNAMHVVKLLDHCYEKELKNAKAKINIFIHPPRNTSRIMCTMVTVFSNKTNWMILNTFFRAITVSIIFLSTSLVLFSMVCALILCGHNI